MTDNNRHNRPSNIDLEETIQFTEEDLGRLRRPNRQPVDGDYFTEQLTGNEEMEKGSDRSDFSLHTESHRHHQDEKAASLTGPKYSSEAETTPRENSDYSSLNSNASRPKEFQSYPNEEVIDEYPDFAKSFYRDSGDLDKKDKHEKMTKHQPLDDSYPVDPEEVRVEEATFDNDTELVESAGEFDETNQDSQENPFVYKSVANQLRSKYEAEKEKELKIARERREKLLKKFEDTYEPVYDENNLSGFDQYNQFDDPQDLMSENEVESESPIAQRHKQQQKDKPVKEALSDSAVKNFSFTDFLGHIKDSITSKFNRNEEELAQLNQATEDYERERAIRQEPSVKVQPMEVLEEERESKVAEIELEESLALTESEADTTPRQSMDMTKADRPEEQLNQSDYQFEATNGEVVVLSNETVEVQSEPVNKFSEKNDVGQVLDHTSHLNIEEVSEQIAQTTQAFDGPILTDQVLDEMIVNDDMVINDVQEEEASFVKGTAWLTAGNIISRILGALYVIPWGTWFGKSYTTANVLYGIGYNPYALFLAISTAGFPSAIAKQMAFYHSKKQYRSADKIFKNSLLVMLVSGLVSGALLFGLAPYIASISSTDNPQAAVVVIRSLAPALIILPVMSLLRGYFQGFGDMVPTAVSQILEQIARVVYMLAATYAIMKVLDGNVTNAVAHSTFAAFVGAVLSLVYLVVLYLRRRGAINLLIESSEETEETLDFKESLKILLKDSIPFILLGSGIIIAKFIDQITFKFILETTSTMLLSDISELFGVMNLDVDKLIMIIISIAVGMSLSSIPLITKLYANHEEGKTADLIEKISILFLLVMSPAAFGMASIANNMYQLFYPYGHEAGPSLLVTASVLSIILGAYTILSTIIQSMNYRRAAIQYLLIGLAVKVALQFPLVAWLNAHGALMATLIGFLVTCILTIWKLNELVHLDFKGMLPDMMIIYAATFLMALSASFWNASFNLLFGPVGRLLTFVKILVVVLLAGFIYFGVLALFGKLSLLLGDKNRELQEKLRMF